MNDLVNPPEAGRLISALRDTGYDFNSAAADIIDNSIAANATEVKVCIDLLQDGRKLVYFGDNGDGMDSATLHQAMRYGSPIRLNPKSLGKFGIGLKTASTSVCKKLTVISRKSANDEFCKLSWDLEHVNTKNSWEMLKDPATNDELEIFDQICGKKGTLVVWSNCDRLLQKDYEVPGGALEQQAIKRLAVNLDKHVSLVYHRFLDVTDERERNVRILINNIEVKPWNPFYPERSEQILHESKQEIIIEPSDGESTDRIAKVRAWVLPHSRDISKEEESKARISNRAQGFYIYREGRLIQDGGWLNVFGPPEPHSSLLRIEFDFGHELDEAFKTDVKKSRILFDIGLEEFLKTLLTPAYRYAQDQYRRKNRVNATEIVINHSSANKSIANTSGTRKPTISSVDASAQTAIIENNRGPTIRIRQPIENNVSSKSIHVEAVDSINNSDLWQPTLRSVKDSGHVPAVLLNKQHDFYNKIYLRAAANGYAVEGMDFLLWAFSTAELNNTDDELVSIWNDIRLEISTNLTKLLRNLPDPESGELKNTAYPLFKETDAEGD
jgi:hypothetical protein